MGDFELCPHVCARCGGCPGCCPGHTREDQRDAWRQALAERARATRLGRTTRRQAQPYAGYRRAP